MPFLQTKSDKLLIIPPRFKGFLNEETLTIEFKEGVAKEVPEKVAVYYTKNYPHFYKIVNGKESGNEIEPDNPEEEPEPEVFDPVGFLDKNFGTIEEAIQNLNRVELFKVAKSLELKVPGNISTDRLKERIGNDVKAKNEHYKKLEEEVE